MKRIIGLILVICTVLALFSGCGGDKEIRINFPIDSDPKYLDPQIAIGSSAQLIAVNCFEGLLRYDKDGQLKNGVAEDYDISSDGTTYTFRLRTDAKWHLIEDFEEILGKGFEKSFNNSVTAHDFVFAMRRAVSPEIASPSVSSLYSIKNAKDISFGKTPVDKLGVTALDDYTLQIKLEHPDPDFLSLLTTPVFMPCNQKFYEATSGRYGTDAKFLLCNAPMHLSSWDSDGTYVILEKSDDYKGEAEAVATSIGFYVNTDIQSRLSKLNDKTYCATPVDESLIDGIDKNYVLKTFENSNYSLVFNFDDIVFSNLYLRLAFCYGINRSDTTRPQGLIPDTCRTGTESYRSRAGKASMISYNENNAKTYFDRGFSELENPPDNITLLCTAETESLAKSLLPDWQILFGYRLIVKIEVTDSLPSRLQSGDFTFAIAPISSENDTAVNFISHLSGEDEKNISNYNSQNLDTILKQLQKSTNAADLTAGCKQAEEHLMQNGLYYPLLTKKSYFAVHKDYENIVVFPSGENICFVK